MFEHICDDQKCSKIAEQVPKFKRKQSKDLKTLKTLEM